MFALYLIMYGCIAGMAAEGTAGTMMGAAMIYMAVDFSLRFIVQTTPGMMVKPYILQPISRYTAIECFLVGEHVSGYNFLWLCMFVPYGIILLFAGESFGLVLYEVIAAEILIILNSQIYPILPAHSSIALYCGLFRLWRSMPCPIQQYCSTSTTRQRLSRKYSRRILPLACRFTCCHWYCWSSAECSL